MASGAPVDYRITSVTPETKYTATATPIPGKVVAYSTSTGYEGSAFVPDTAFGNLVTVRQIIEAEVRQVAAVQALTGTIAG